MKIDWSDLLFGVMLLFALGMLGVWLLVRLPALY
jgi:hypothetical protein